MCFPHQKKHITKYILTYTWQKQKFHEIMISADKNFHKYLTFPSRILLIERWGLCPPFLNCDRLCNCFKPVEYDKSDTVLFPDPSLKRLAAFTPWLSKYMPWSLRLTCKSKYHKPQTCKEIRLLNRWCCELMDRRKALGDSASLGSTNSLSCCGCWTAVCESSC